MKIWSGLHRDMQQFFMNGHRITIYVEHTGKSEIVRQIAKIFKLKMIDIRLSQVDPTELNGFGCIQNGVAKYIPMEIFPLENTPIPEGYNGFLLFLDEINAAPKSVEAASYKLTLDRMVGSHKLHPKTAIVCAGNLTTSGAIVNRQGTAMQSRLVHLVMTADAVEWVKWASKNKLDYRVISYISNLPNALHEFDPKHNDKTFSCPRTWEFVSKILKVAGSTPLTELRPLLAGTIGEGMAMQFVAYANTLIELPTIDEIKSNPQQAKLSREPSLRHATSHLVATHLSDINIDSLMIYIRRMPMEFQAITLRNAINRNNSLTQEDLIQEWICENGERLLEW